MSESTEHDLNSMAVSLGLTFGTGLGVTFGTIIGVLMDNVGMGIAFGIPLGAGLGLTIGIVYAAITQKPSKTQCPNCGYLTQGLRTSICPECGIDRSESHKANTQC